MALNNVIRTTLVHRFFKTTNTILTSSSHRISVAYYSSDDKQIKKKIPEEINSFMLKKYTNYIKNYEHELAKRFPKAMTVYKGFMEGISLFYQDLKQYIKILAKVNAPGKGIQDLARKELEIYLRVPKEMVKLAPILIGSGLPLGYTILMPLAYWFPRVFLTEHFLSKTEREKYKKELMVQRIRQARIIVKMISAPNVCLQRHLTDEKLWILVQAEMKTNQLIYPHKLIGCIDLFKGVPFHLDKLSRLHIIHLAKLHNINTFWFPKKYLKQKAQLILAMDRAIIREGGIKSLSVDDMRYICALRGLYAEELDAEAMKQWLNNWMHISVSADESSLSLLLHASAIFGYNAPANRKLLKSAGCRGLTKIRINSRAALKRMTN